MFERDEIGRGSEGEGVDGFGENACGGGLPDCFREIVRRPVATGSSETERRSRAGVPSFLPLGLRRNLEEVVAERSLGRFRGEETVESREIRSVAQVLVNTGLSGQKVEGRGRIDGQISGISEILVWDETPHTGVYTGISVTASRNRTDLRIPLGFFVGSVTQTFGRDWSAGPEPKFARFDTERVTCGFVGIRTGPVTGFWLEGNGVGLGKIGGIGLDGPAGEFDGFARA